MLIFLSFRTNVLYVQKRVISGMATSWATETPEKINHAKLCRLLYDGGATAVRAVVDRHCPPATLAATLKAKKTQLQKLKKPKGKVLNNDQWDKLYPPSGASPSTNDFDITLLFVLIRNICGLTAPATGWDALPPTTDTSTEANLARIKYYRNKVIGHSEKGEIDDVQYEAFWNDISSALVSLGLDQDDVDDLKGRPLGAEDYYKLLKDWYLEDIAIKDQLCDIESKVDKVAEGVTNLEKKISQIPSEIDKLCHQEFRSRISSKCDLYHPNTKEWILDQVKAHVESSFKEGMVIQAGPGMGKSVLAVKICQIYREQGILGACHFFQHNDPSRNNPRLMLQSVSRQLCDSLPDYKAAVEKVLRSDHMRKNISDLSCTELFTLLFEEACSRLDHEPTGKLVVVIDALDECSNSLKKEFFRVMRDKLCYLPSWLRFVMTTRPPPSISSQVGENTIQIDSEDSQNMGDLRRFFTDTLKEMGHLSSDQQHPNQVEQLVALTEGFFLVASFVIDFLKKPGVNSLTEALEHFPKGISSVYEDYFSRLRDEITPHLKSEEGFYNMLDAVVKAKSPIEKSIFYDILGLNRENSRVPDSKRKEAINLLHQLFPVENDHVSPFHKTVFDWLTSGDHDFVAKGDGNEVLAGVCYDAFKNIKQEILKNQNQPTQLTDKEIYASEFGFDYMKESQSFGKGKAQVVAADPYVLCALTGYDVNMQNDESHQFPHGFHEKPFSLQLSPDVLPIYDQIKALLTPRKCIIENVTFMQCLEFTFRALNVMEVETEENTLQYLKENCLPYHERERVLKLTNINPLVVIDVLPTNDGFLLKEHCDGQTLVKKYHCDGTFVSEIQLNGNFKFNMSPDYKSIVVYKDERLFTDNIDIRDSATLEKVTSYRLPNFLKSLHVFGGQSWYIVARCFDNTIYIVEGETGKLVGNPCTVQQNENVLCVSKAGHILLTRTSLAHYSNNQDGVFTDEEKRICHQILLTQQNEALRPLEALDRPLVALDRPLVALDSPLDFVSCEIFLCHFKELDKRIPIYFRFAHCPGSKWSLTWPGKVYFSEDGDLLAFEYSLTITVVRTSDGSLYTSICLGHYQNLMGSNVNILYLSKTRIVIKGISSIFSYSFTGESRPLHVGFEHVYYLPPLVMICFVSRSSNNVRELWCKRIENKIVRVVRGVAEQREDVAIEKCIFHNF